MKTLTPLLLLLLLGLCGLSMQGCDRKKYKNQRTYGGNQIGPILSRYNIGQCQNACTKNERCKYFNLSGGYYCRLFTDGRLRRYSVHWGYTGYSLRLCRAMQCKAMRDVNMQRRFYRRVPNVGSAEACSTICYNDRRCRFYGYSRSDASYAKRVCYLKDGVPVRTTEYTGITSGYSPRYCK